MADFLVKNTQKITESFKGGLDGPEVHTKEVEIDYARHGSLAGEAGEGDLLFGE